jgi:hypothetical protein
MTELDDALRESFARLAEPGDPAGVVDSIRSRVDAGDTGTPADSSGFGGGGSGALAWLPWGAMVVVAGLIGAGAVSFGFIGKPVDTVVQLTVLAVDATTDAYDCPGGAAVSTFSANERALVVARTEDSAWLGVRDSYDYSRTVWLPASVVSVDPGQGDVDVVPVQSCVVPNVVINTPAPVVTAEPQKPSVDAAPQITGVTQSAKEIHQTGFQPDHSDISVSAVDDHKVTSVTASWPASPGVTAGTANAVFSGGTWNFTFGPFVNPGYSSTSTITIIAKDAAGHQSAPRTISVTMTFLLI